MSSGEWSSSGGRRGGGRGRDGGPGRGRGGFDGGRGEGRGGGRFDGGRGGGFGGRFEGGRGGGGGGGRFEGGRGGGGGRFEGGRGGGGGGGRGGRGGGFDERGGGFGAYMDVPPPSTPIPPMPPQPKRSELEKLEQLTGLTFKNLPSIQGAFPPRPDRGGTEGTRVRLRLNHFPLSLDYSRLDVHHYDVVITPAQLPRKVCREVLAEAVRQFGHSHFGGRLPAFDGVKNLFTAGPLPSDSLGLDVTLPDNRPQREGAPPKERKFFLAIKLAARIDMQQLQVFMSGRTTEIPQIGIQLLDVVLRERPLELLYMDVGRSFFSPELGTVAPLGGGAECWKGFYQTVRATQSGLTVNVDMAATAFLEPSPVPNFVMGLLGRRDLTQPLNDSERIRVRKALNLRKVEVTHRGNMRRKYTVKGITSRPLKDLTFPTTGDDGEEHIVKVTDYFQMQYNVQLRLLNMPCLDAGSPSRPNYLPLEVCKIVSGQPYKTKLNDVQTSNILVQAARKPREREDEISKTVQRTSYNASSLAREFGFSVSNQMTEMSARILNPPTLEYAQQQTIVPQGGAWNMRGKKVVQGAQVRRWAAVNLSRVPDMPFNEFCRNLASMCNTTGLTMQTAPVQSVRAPPDQYENVLRQLARANTPPGQTLPALDIVICVLNENNGPLYGYLKRLCETDLGLMTQCCLAKNIGKGPQYNANVALKINAKVGGTNAFLSPHTSRIPLLSQHQGDMTMLIGADVTHPTQGDDNSPSIAAVVGSMEWPGMGQYKALVSAQSSKVEIIKDLYKCAAGPRGQPQHEGMIRQLLLSFYTYRNRRVKPNRLIMYRDGVSEGQFDAVKRHEVMAIKRACASMEESYNPKLTFVIVQKRHHTRFFVPDRSMQDRSGNALPGTVVDTHICHPTDFDFYLMSHAGIQGTSRPTHYHVVHDENGFDSNSMQKFTYHLTYIYARCTRSVSVVPPAYYAHLVAFRARFYTDAEASESGSQAGREVGGGQGGSGASGGDSSTSTSRSPSDIVVRPLPMIRENVLARMFFS